MKGAAKQRDPDNAISSARNRSTRQGARGVKKLGWKHSFTEIMVAIGRTRRRDVSNNILQQSLAELRRTKQAGSGNTRPSDGALVNGKLTDGSSPPSSLSQTPEAR
jgi:hypothetical protein